MKNNISIEDIAYNGGFELIESVKGGQNGYPSGIKKGIVGFENFEDLQRYADKYGLIPCTFHKRDGWHLYERKDTPYQPLQISASDYGDDYKQFTNSISQEEFLEQEVLPVLPSTTFDDIITFVHKYEEVFDHICVADDDELVIMDFCGNYVETVQAETMQWSHDTHTYVIGLVEE